MSDVDHEVTVDENSGSLTEVFEADATHHGEGTTQIYATDGTAVNGEDYVFAATTGYNSGGHGHQHTGYPETVQIVDNSLSKGSKDFDLIGVYPDGDTEDYHVTIDMDDPAPPSTPAIQKFVAEFKQAKLGASAHPFQSIGDFIRGHEADDAAASADMAEITGVQNAATLNGSGEVAYGSVLAGTTIIAGVGAGVLGTGATAAGEPVAASLLTGGLIDARGGSVVSHIGTIGQQIQHTLQKAH